MDGKILIYAGTTEGRLLAQQLSRAGIACDVHVATEYGQMVMPELPGVQVHVGRLTEEEMHALLKQHRKSYLAVVDATHPYATEVSKYIRKSVEGLDIPYLRLLRKMESNGRKLQQLTAEIEPIKKDLTSGTVCYFEDYTSCANALMHTTGNILLTTGSKELHTFLQASDRETISDREAFGGGKVSVKDTRASEGENALKMSEPKAIKSLRERLFVRVLPGTASIALCEQAGIRGKQILAMQGPFSKEMNLAMIHQFSIRYLVTKESGAHSGFQEKLEAAQEAGIVTCIIGKKEKEQGVSFSEVIAELSRLSGVEISSRPEIEIALIGIGMGASTLTQEAREAIDQVDIVFGAKRMLAVVDQEKEKYPFYLAKDILPVLAQKEASMEGGNLKIAILFSGDTGFYSGAEKIKSELKANHYENIRIFPGISSVSYLAAAAGVPWQEAKILSIHGLRDDRRAQAIVCDGALHNRWSFLLVSGVEDIRKIGYWIQKLNENIVITVGYQLSYPQEKVVTCSCNELQYFQEEGLYTLLIQNDQATMRRVVPGVNDHEFLRILAKEGTALEKAKTVPMTKEEIRALSLCKLALTESAVVYDIGAGTGSIAVECALRSPDIRVYAIEQKEAAQQLLRKNIERFQLLNVVPVDGSAPEILKNLEPPTHVFIGGSSGQLAEILRIVWEKNEDARVVVTAVSLETIAQITDLTKKEKEHVESEIVQLQVSRAKPIGSYHLMQAENPVYLCVLERKRAGNVTSRRETCEQKMIN